VLFRRIYKEGPADAHEEVLERPGLEPDIVVSLDGRSFHYKLTRPLPDSAEEPLPLHYLFVTEFDPESDYVESVADAQFGPPTELEASG
jgi:hypothetical protein